MNGYSLNESFSLGRSDIGWAPTTGVNILLFANKVVLDILFGKLFSLSYSDFVYLTLMIKYVLFHCVDFLNASQTKLIYLDTYHMFSTCFRIRMIQCLKSNGSAKHGISIPQL